MTDRVFATAKLGTAYVFRHNFAGNKWENVTNRKDGSSAVTFRKRGSSFFIRIAPEGGAKEEHELSPNAQIKDSGDGFIQVPLPDKKQLIGLKFKQKDEGPIFLGKIREQMDIKGEVTMQAVVLEEKPDTAAPNPDLLPKAMTGYGGTPPASKPAPPPPQENYGNVPLATMPATQPSGGPVDGHPTVQPVGQPVTLIPTSGQPAFNTGQPGFNTGQPVFQPPFNTGQPVFKPEQPQMKTTRPLVTEGVMPGTRGPAPPAVPAPRPDVRPPPPPPRTEPEVPSFSVGEDVKSDHAAFLANAINVGNFEAAHRVINMLQKMNVQSKQAEKKMNITYADCPNSIADDVDVTLNLEIEFQSQHKSTLRLYLDFKASMTVALIQQELELSHHIPKATQNWIISDQLVKGDLLHKTLRDFGIDGRGTTAKVFVYVMHSKKAQVPKEEYEAIRQCQQEERERKKQGLKPPWHQMNQHMTPPTIPPRATPPTGLSEYTPQEPGTTIRTLMPAGEDYIHRRQAWQPPGNEENLYSRTNHNIPTPGVAPPPVRRQVNPDPTYEELVGYQPHPGEVRQYPAANPLSTGYPPPSAVHNPPPQPSMATPQQHPAGYHQEFHQPPGPPQQSPRPPLLFQSAMCPELHQPPGPPQPVPQPRLHHQPLPPQHRGPPPPARLVGWSCPQCTFINKPRRPGCEICAADRPEDYQIPDDIPMDADEARIVEGLRGSDDMFQQFREAERKRKEKERVENFQALLQAEEEEALVANDEEFECPVCLTPIEPGEGVRLRGCLHQFCKECLAQSIMASPDAEVKCPFVDNDYQCNVPLPEREIRQLVSADELEQLYRRALREAESAAANSYHCKSTNCEGFCFYEDEVNEFDCPICKKVNCLTCKAIHEGVNCQEYQDDLRRRAANDEAAKATQEMLDKMVQDGDAMNCPSCEIVVQKKDGCDWIRCSVCKTEICWATKQARWGPKGKGDTSGGCHCREKGKKCHPLCRNCH